MPPVLFDQLPDQLADGQSFEVAVVVAAADDLATDQPEVVAVAIEGGFGYPAPQQVE